MLKKKTYDPDTEAALSVVEMEKNQEVLKETEQETRERLIGQTHEMVGQIRAATMFKKFADVSSFVWMRQVKETKIYKDLPNLGTWESFCNYIGISRQHADEQLANLSTLGEEFLRTVSGLSVGYRDLKKLRRLTHDGDVTIEAEYAVIGEERIPLDKDHTEDLQAAIESLLESKNKQIEEQTSTIKAKDKVLKDKETVINRQAKELAKLEGRAAEVGYTPAEENLIRDMDNARTTIDGFLMKFDPEKAPLPADASPRMKATLVYTLDYFRRVVTAAYDTAVDVYGEPELDDDWVPFHLRKNGEDQDNDGEA